MKKPYLTHVSLFMNVAIPVKVGPLKLNALYQMVLYETKEGIISHDFECLDYEDAEYMGVKMEPDYEAWQTFIKYHKSMGIDFNQLIDKEVNSVFGLCEQNKMLAKLINQKVIKTIKHED